MPSFASVECDIVDVSTGEKLRTVRLAAVPQHGDEIHLDFGEHERHSGLYRIARVLYHIRPRKLVRTDDIIGVSLYVERAAAL